MCLMNESLLMWQESEEMRSNSLDIQLREKEEELKLHFREKEDHMEVGLLYNITLHYILHTVNSA